MKKHSQFDAYAYGIQTERVVMEGEAYFKTTAQEFPHLEVYEATPAAAYEVIIQAIQDLHAAAAADKRPFPAPNETADDTECSGRVTLRMPKPLHRRLLNQARRNGMPLNTEIVTQLSETSAMHELATQVIAQIPTVHGLAVTGQSTVFPSYTGGESANVVDVRMNPWGSVKKPTSLFTVSTGSSVNSKFLSDDPHVSR